MEKRKRIARILVIIFLLGSVAVAAASLLGPGPGKEDISFEEKTLKGDIKEAEGLTVERSFTYQDEYIWTSRLVFDGSSFTVGNDADKMSEEIESEEKHISFICHDEVIKDEELINDAKGKAKDGNVRIDCRDHLKYYEMQTDENAEGLKEFFKVPVTEDAAIIYEYDDEYGEVYEGRTGIQEFALREESLCGRTYAYLPYDETFEWMMGSTYDEIEDMNGFRSFLDESEIPGGYGLYEIQNGDVENVFTPENGGRMEGLCEGDDNTLIIITCEDDIIYANVFNAETKEVLQKIEIGGGLIPEEYQIDDRAAQTSMVRNEDGHTWIITAENIVILDKKGDRYAKAVDYEIDDDFNIYLSEETALAYDGEKAAIAGLKSSDWNGELWSYGFNLAVIDKEGLKYSGEFTSSMDEDINEKDNIPEYEFFFDGFMSLRWNEE